MRHVNGLRSVGIAFERLVIRLLQGEMGDLPGLELVPTSWTKNENVD